MKKKIVILEDDQDIRELVVIHLKKNGYDAIEFEEIAPLYDFLEQNTPDMMILDLMLPDGDGFDVCKKVRRDNRLQFTPIIMLTAKGEEFDKVLGLELGADDYITKPFSPRELMARIKTVLRRSVVQTNSAQDEKTSRIVIDQKKYEVFVDEKKVDLTSTEFKIIKLLSSRKGWVFSRNQILDYLWGKDKIVLDRTVDVHVKHLRKKLGDAGVLIKNVRGVGYKMEED